MKNKTDFSALKSISNELLLIEQKYFSIFGLVRNVSLLSGWLKNMTDEIKMFIICKSYFTTIYTQIKDNVICYSELSFLTLRLR